MKYKLIYPKKGVCCKGCCFSIDGSCRISTELILKKGEECWAIKNGRSGIYIKINDTINSNIKVL